MQFLGTWGSGGLASDLRGISQPEWLYGIPYSLKIPACFLTPKQKVELRPCPPGSSQDEAELGSSKIMISFWPKLRTHLRTPQQGGSKRRFFILIWFWKTKPSVPHSLMGWKRILWRGWWLWAEELLQEGELFRVLSKLAAAALLSPNFMGPFILDIHL